MILISVDLPAPFSPISACTSPDWTLKSTSSSARTPGNAFETPSISIRAVKVSAPRAAVLASIAKYPRAQRPHKRI